ATANDGTVETSVQVSFVPPVVASVAGPGIPLLSLASAVSESGALKSGQTLYYAVAGVDTAGNESALSFIVQAIIENNGNSVTLSELSVAPGTASFHVYRGTTPVELLRIATAQPISPQFTDSGEATQLIAAPDPNFDHTNFYWRLELQPEFASTAHSASSVG